MADSYNTGLAGGAYTLTMEDFKRTASLPWDTSIITPAIWSGTGIAYNGAKLRPESPRDKCSRYIAEISEAIGSGSRRTSNEKNNGRKKSGPVSESNSKRALRGSGPTPGLY
jgi:spermidine/putrescine-binding protein